MSVLDSVRFPPIVLHRAIVKSFFRSEYGRQRLKCDGTRAETRFRLSVKRTSPFKCPGGVSYSTTGSRGVRISGSNAGYTMFGGSVKGTGYLLHSPVSPSLPLPFVTVCYHISTGLYQCADPSILIVLSDSASTAIKAKSSPYVPCHIGSGCMAPFILELGFRWKRMVSSCPGPYTSAESVPFIH